MNPNPIKETTAGAILAIEMEINLLEGDLEAIEHDLAYLHAYRGTLVYNHIFLKRDKVVTSMFEYKRTNKELLQVDVKLLELRNLSVKVNRKMDIKLKALDFYHDLYEQEEIIESEKILLFIRKDKWQLLKKWKLKRK